MKSKLAITGSNGFVGKNTVSYLENVGFEMVSINLRGCSRPRIQDNVKWVLHLAGKAHDLKNTSDPSEYFIVNTELTKSIFESFLESNAETFIYVSSVKAVADVVQGDILTENQLPNPRTPYGKSKLAAEEYLLGQKLPSNKKLIILRPCMIHGPGNKGNLNLLYSMTSLGIPWPLGYYENRRSFLSIDNFCFVIWYILQDKVAAGIYNLADTTPLSTKDIVQIIGEGMKKKVRIMNVNPRVIYTIAWLGDIFPLPLNTERLNKLTENYIVSNVKILNALEINFPVDSRSGLLHTIQSFEAEKI